MTELPAPVASAASGSRNWHDQAKVGVLLTWGLFSVPAWAPLVADPAEIAREEGVAGLLKINPYTEWYANAMRVPGSPTRQFHESQYGIDFAYRDFVAEFDRRSSEADIAALADICRRSGAQYAIVTAKHHDGFCLWPTPTPHPRMGAFHSSRDLVGDFSTTVRSAGMRFGVYYSGGYDWPYNQQLIANAADAVLAVQSGRYSRYAGDHLHHLVDAYAPDLLWNDICWPTGGDVSDVIDHYRTQVPHGVINDRWEEVSFPSSPDSHRVSQLGTHLLRRTWRLQPDPNWRHDLSSRINHDFATVPPAANDGSSAPWELVAGLGTSLGYNANEQTPGLDCRSLVRVLGDVISRNGNLLLGASVTPDGVLPAWQERLLLEFGDWLSRYGKAVFDTAPWTVANATAGNTQAWFVQSPGNDQAPDNAPGTVWAIVDRPGANDRMRIPGLEPNTIGSVALPMPDGTLHPLTWRIGPHGLAEVDLPLTTVDPVVAVAITPRSGHLAPHSV